MGEGIVVRLGPDATAEDVAGVEAAFREAGIPARVEATWQRPPGVGNGPVWIAEVRLDVVITAFLTGYFGAASIDAWRKTKEWASRIRQGMKSPVPGAETNVVLNDPEGTQVMLFEHIPDEAYQRLFELDWSRYRPGLLIWDDDRRDWRNVNE